MIQLVVRSGKKSNIDFIHIEKIYTTRREVILFLKNATRINAHLNRYKLLVYTEYNTGLLGGRQKLRRKPQHLRLHTSIFTARNTCQSQMN